MKTSRVGIPLLVILDIAVLIFVGTKYSAIFLRNKGAWATLGLILIALLISLYLLVTLDKRLHSVLSVVTRNITSITYAGTIVTAVAGFLAIGPLAPPPATTPLSSTKFAFIAFAEALILLIATTAAGSGITFWIRLNRREYRNNDYRESAAAQAMLAIVIPTLGIAGLAFTYVAAIK